MWEEPSEAMAPKSGAMVVVLVRSGDSHYLRRSVYSW